MLLWEFERIRSLCDLPWSFLSIVFGGAGFRFVRLFNDAINLTLWWVYWFRFTLWFKFTYSWFYWEILSMRLQKREFTFRRHRVMSFNTLLIRFVRKCLVLWVVLVTRVNPFPLKDFSKNQLILQRQPFFVFFFRFLFPSLAKVFSVFPLPSNFSASCRMITYHLNLVV